MPKLSIVIPAKDEQDNIGPLVQEIVEVFSSSAVPASATFLPLMSSQSALTAVAGLQPQAAFVEYEIVYVDDGSKDATFDRLCQFSILYPQLKVVRHKFGVGQSTALATGIEAASGNLIVTMDADGQNDPADIPVMLERALQFQRGQHFCIAGFRIHRKDTGWRRMQSKIANGIRSRLLHDATPDTGCGLKIFPRQTYLRLPYFDHMHRFLPALILRMGGKVVVHPVNHRQRLSGISKYSMLNRAWVGIIDILGVMWLLKRNQQPELIEVSLNENV